MKKATLRSIRKVALVEAAGIEPASREESAVASTHVVDYLIVTLEAPADGLNFWLAKN